MRALIVILLLTSCQAFSFQKPVPQKDNAENKASESKQNPSNNSPSIGECIGCFNEQPPHTGAEKNDPYNAGNDSLYRWYLGATIVGVCGGIVGLIILIAQTIATHKAANAADKNATALINSERAWLQARIDSYHPLSQWVPPPYHPFVWLRVYVKNYGRTPAIVTKIVARAHVLPKGGGIWPPRLPATPVYEPSPADPHVTVHEREMTLLPRQRYPIITEINEAEDLHAVKSKETMLYVYGYVDYFDLGGAPRQTRFCKLYWIPAMLTDPHEEGFMESIIIPADYTKST